MAELDIAAIKERTKAVWALGDYSEIERLTGQAAPPLVDACAISAGQEVLDVAAGSGNVALAAATEGARVVACDITPEMLDRGRARACAAGVDVEWVEADAEELPFDDASFDCVASAFGLILAPRPEVVVREAFRVLRPGGTFGITSWTPDSMIPAQSELIGRYLPRPAELPVPSEWGDPATVRARLDGFAASIETQLGEAVWRGSSPEAYVASVEQNAGPQVAARQALDPERYEELSSGLLELVRERASGSGTVEIGLEYLLTVARKLG